MRKVERKKNTKENKRSRRRDKTEKDEGRGKSVNATAQMSLVSALLLAVRGELPQFIDPYSIHSGTTTILL